MIEPLIIELEIQIFKITDNSVYLSDYLILRVFLLPSCGEYYKSVFNGVKGKLIKLVCLKQHVPVQSSVFMDKKITQSVIEQQICHS